MTAAAAAAVGCGPDDGSGAALALAGVCSVAAGVAMAIATARGRRAERAERALEAERRARAEAEARRGSRPDAPPGAAARRDDERLTQTDRMASVGLLTASLAHELAQPLGYVLDSVRFASEELERAEPPLAEVRAALGDARAGGEQVRRLLGELRSFARPGGDDDAGPAEVAPVVESALRIAAAELRHRARLTVDVQPVPAVALAPHRLAQIVLNLVVNAAQAIPPGEPARNEVRVRVRREGAAVVLEVADTGAGIPGDVLPRLFEPFFTTKPPGVGTGLGLAIVKRLLDAAGGAIVLESAPGQGTTAVVTLPVASEARGAAPARTPAPERPARGRILVVDDEADVARILVRALETEHEVHAETDPERALARLRSGEAFDVVLCDVVMPTLDGLSIHDAVEKVRPAQAARFVFLTGAGRGGSAPIATLGRLVVEKPFDLDAVRALVRARVHASRAAAGS